jgi:hypothetical protein
MRKFAGCETSGAWASVVDTAARMRKEEKIVFIMWN